MALCFIIDTPGGNHELYERAIELIRGNGPFPPEGHVFQAAGPVDGGWRVVDVWASQEHFDRFMAERLGPALREAQAPQPDVNAFPVHAHFGAGVPAEGAP